MNIAVIFAGGRGQRLDCSTDATPKQFLKINGKPILIHTLKHFENHNEIDKIYISILPEYKEYTEKLIKEYSIAKVKKVVEGGETGQDSIYKALKSASEENPENSIVLIHDGVRPIITEKVITDNINTAREKGNAITSTPCCETILVSKDGITPNIIPIRKETFSAQAPQTFILSEIMDAHERVRKTEAKYTDIVDSCTLFNKLGKQTYLVRGNFGNIKITTREDMYILKGILDFEKDIGIEKCKPNYNL